MKILITGANGFIGSSLASTLKIKYPDSKIYLLDLRINNPLLDPSQYYSIEKDLLTTQNSDLPEVDVVIHAAALLGVGYVNSNPLDVILSNISAFSCLKKYIINPAVKFIFFSTSEVYGDGASSQDKNVVLRENHPDQSIPLPNLDVNRSSYALSKIVGEFMASRSDNFLCLRPHNIYGPNMGHRHVIPNLIEKTIHARETKVLEIYNPTHIRSFCYIDDAVAQIISLLQADAKGIYNIGNPSEPIKILDLAQKILESMKVEATITVNNEDVGSPAFRRPVLTQTHSSFVPLNTGIQHMIDYYSSKPNR